MGQEVQFKTGIYFLIQNHVVIYVGKTTRFPKRLEYHRGQLMPYDSVKFFPCNSVLLDYYEERWIRWFKPEYNRTLKNSRRKIRRTVKIKVISIKRPMKFRRLSELSRFGFGSHRHDTVEHFLKHGKHLHLAGMYYRLSHISFLDEVLEKIGIVGHWRISKPGTNKEMYQEFATTVYPEQFKERYEKAVKYSYKESLKVLSGVKRGNISKAYNRMFNQKQ